MSTDSDQLRSAYNVVCDDEHLVEEVVGIISDVYDGVFSKKEPLSYFYTVGDIRRIPGFYASDFLLHDMIGIYIGRLTRMICIGGGLSLVDPDIMKFIVETDEQQRRCVPLVKQALMRKYGEPPYVATGRIKQLKQKIIDGFHRMGIPISDDIGDTYDDDTPST